MKYLLVRFFVFFTILALTSQTLFAHENDLDKLRESRKAYQEAASAMTPEEIDERNAVLEYALGIGGGLTGVAVLGVAIARYKKMHQKPKLNLSSLDLYAMQEKVSARLRPGALYPVSDLGPEAVPLLETALERWKASHVYSWQRVFRFSPTKAYQVNKGMELAFQEEMAAMYAEYINGIKISGDLMLQAGEKGVEQTSKAWSKEFEKRVIKSMKKGGPLSQYVTEVTGTEGVSLAMRKAVGERAIGRVGILAFAKKAAPVVLLGLVLGNQQARASEAEVLRRIDENPSLLLAVSDQEFEFVAASSALSQRYIEASQTWLAMDKLSDEDKQFLQHCARTNKEEKDRAQRQAALLKLQQNLIR